MSSIRKTIGYADDSLNVLGGCLGPEAKGPCPYCFAKDLARRFGPERFRSYPLLLPYPDDSPERRIELVKRALDSGAWDCGKADGPWPHGFWPTFYPERLDVPRKRRKPTVWFMSDCGDLWQKWVPARIIQAVLDMAEECERHRFLFLTRYPERYSQFRIPDNCWAGTTVTGEGDQERLGVLFDAAPGNRWISYEPVLGGFPLDVLRAVDWVTVGAMTGPGARRPELVDAWVTALLIDAGEHKVPVFLKSNLGPQWEPHREYPEGLVIG